MSIEQTNSVTTNYIVYKHTSPSGKSYIGITNNYERRCYYHQHKSTPCRAFAKAIKKYGWNNFTHELLATGLTLHSANNFEEFYIRHFNTFGKNGYNLRSGGESSTPCEESKQKMSESKIGEKSPFFGKFGKYNHKSKVYLIIFPQGKYDIITGLTDWCRDKNLDRTGLGAVARGKIPHYKGYFCQHVYINQYTTEELQEKSNNWVKWIDLHNGPNAKGEYHKGSKKYIVTTPEGEYIFVHGLRKFCNDNNLDKGRMGAVANGGQKKHKGFSCEHFNESKHIHLL